MPLSMSCDRAEPVFEAANRIEQIRHEQAIDDEAAAIGRADRLLADRLHEPHQRIVRLLARRQRANHFDQLHQRHGIEEVQAADLVGPLRAGASSVMQSDDVFDAIRQFGPDHGLDLRVGLLLDLDVLDDRFDHEVAVLQVGVLGRAGEIAEHGLSSAPR